MSERTPRRGDRIESLMTGVVASGVAVQAALLIEMIRRLLS